MILRELIPDSALFGAAGVAAGAEPGAWSEPARGWSEPAGGRSKLAGACSKCSGGLGSSL